MAGDPVLDAAALQFCARKVSAVSGDARKALDVCRSAPAPRPAGGGLWVWDSAPKPSVAPVSPARCRGCPCWRSHSARRSGPSLPRRAVEVVELEVRNQTLLKPLPGGESQPEPKPCGGGM